MKYLGKKDARGLWGIKHTRKPVDDMVGLARGLGPGAPLPYLQLSVSHRGVLVTPHKNNTCNTMDCGMYPIDTISYGVQDLVYTRVFAMIIVKVSLLCICSASNTGLSSRKPPKEEKTQVTAAQILFNATHLFVTQGRLQEGSLSHWPALLRWERG